MQRQWELSVGELPDLDPAAREISNASEKSAKAAKKITTRHDRESHNLNREFTFETFVEGQIQRACQGCCDPSGWKCR